MQLTSTTGITCPGCKKELEIETEGLLGGLFKQLVAGSVLARLKSEGGTITCGNCKHKFYYSGERK